MATNERDLEIKMGLDASGVNAGLDAVTAKVAQSSDKMATSLNKASQSANELGKNLGKAATQSKFTAEQMKQLVSIGTAVALPLIAKSASKYMSEDNAMVTTEVANGAGMGAMIGATLGSVVPVIGTALGTAAGALIGAAAGLMGAGDKLGQAAEAQLKNYEETEQSNRGKVRNWRRNEAKKDESETFAGDMQNDDISDKIKLDMIAKRRAELTKEKDLADTGLTKSGILQSNEATTQALTQFANAKAELKKLDNYEKSIKNGDKKALVDDVQPRQHFATNALTAIGGGINGLGSFQSAQKETNTILNKQLSVLEKISTNSTSNVGWAN